MNDNDKIAKLKETVEVEVRELEALDNDQLILLALSTLVLSSESLPPLLRLPLYKVLRQRAQLDQNKTEILRA